MHTQHVGTVTMLCFPTAPMCSTQTLLPTTTLSSHLLASPSSLPCRQQPVSPRVAAAWPGERVPSARDSTTSSEALGDARSWRAWGLSKRVRTTHSHPALRAAGRAHGRPYPVVGGNELPKTQ